MSIPATGIGADARALYTARDKKRGHRSLRVLLNYISKERLRAPWLDVGSGDSYMRDLLRAKIQKPILDTAVNLDTESLPWSDDTFQTITSFEVLEHLYNPLFHLRELRRVLKPEGNLFVVTPNDYSLIYKLEHLLSRKYRPHFHQFCERDVRDLFEKSGLRIVTLRKFFKSPTGTVARVSRNGLFIHAVKL